MLGIVVLTFPFFGLFTASVLAGFGVLLIGIALLVFGVAEMSSSKALGIAFSMLGILVLIAGLGLFGNIVAFTIIASLWLYLSGFILAISGIIHIFSASKYAKAVGVLGIVLGVVYIILGTFALNPMALAILIGIWLIIAGLTRLL